MATYAPGKAGKSLLALDVAARAATGRRVLDQPAGPALTVVYFDLEMTEDDLDERLVDMGYGPDTDLSQLHYYLLRDVPPLDTAAGGDEARAIAREHNADLVVNRHDVAGAGGRGERRGHAAGVSSAHPGVR